jgi:hypothetical protein
VHTDQFLLDPIYLQCAQGRVLRTHGYHYRPNLPIQRMRYYYGLHVCVTALLPHLESEHATKSEDYADPSFGDGLRVSTRDLANIASVG